MIATASASDPCISVVIPCYERIDFLRNALRSVFSQTLKPSEILVVDDGSPSPIEPTLVQEFPGVHWLYQKNSGVAAARNLGIKMAQNSWIAFLDSDDRWKPLKLEKQWSFHCAHPEVLVSHTNESWIRNNNQVIPPQYLDKSPRSFFERSLHHCLICPSSVIMHQSIVEKVGNFDETLPVCEDYDLWLRILLTEEFGFLDEELVLKYGGHPDQLSRTYWGMDRFRVFSLEKLIQKNESPEKKLLILRVLQKKCEILSKGFKKHGKYLESDGLLAKADKFQALLHSLEEEFIK